MQRRRFPTAAVLSSLGGVRSSATETFQTAEIGVAGNTIFCRWYGQGPAILMVHGFPRTSLMWRFLAPKLAENHTVIQTCAHTAGAGYRP